MNRKNQHLDLALKQIEKFNSFDKYRLKYYSLPKFSLEDIDLQTSICGIKIDFPFYINAITGGSDIGDKINKDLEYVAKKTNILFFPGSYSPILKGESNYYPKGHGFNLGIDKKVDEFITGIKEIKPKFVQIHLNLIQELLMPEGDHNFSEWKINLENILKKINIPIILKETGFGMNNETIEELISMGVKCIDISGMGGTNFANIENSRANKKREYFEKIGYDTCTSLEYSKKFQNNVDILASGGIRNPLDIVKALALGAKAVGISNYFLKILINEGKDKLISTIEEWKTEIKYLMLISNSKNIEELKGKIYKEETWKENQ